MAHNKESKTTSVTVRLSELESSLIRTFMALTGFEQSKAIRILIVKSLSDSEIHCGATFSELKSFSINEKKMFVKNLYNHFRDMDDFYKIRPKDNPDFYFKLAEEIRQDLHQLQEIQGGAKHG